MAVVLVDTCIVSDLTDPDSDWFEWSASTLEAFDDQSAFVINPIIYAECSMLYQTIEEIENLIETLDFEILPIPREALFLAGRAFLRYRRSKGSKGSKGSKSNVLPDFFIGAHAAIEDHPLITRDKGRFATYFPTLRLITP